jgi:hypothetical protein
VTALVAVAALALSGAAGAASPQITWSITSSPGTNDNTAYTTDQQTAYISYHVAFARAATDNGSALTHATSSIPVSCVSATTTCSDITFPAGSKIVFVSSGCPSPSYRPSNADRRGVTCSLGSLKSTGPIVDYTVVVQTPRATDGATSISAAADLVVKEGTSDSQPQSSYIDTFFTSTITNPLSSDINSSLFSFTNPTDTDGQTFSTDQSIGTGNPQSTKANIPSPGGLGVGVLVHLAEGGFSSCPSTTQTCFGQLSTIEVGGSAPNGGLFACVATNLNDTNCLQFTVVVAGSTLTTNVSASKVTIFHTWVDANNVSHTESVPRCSTKTTDGSGDCIVSVTQNPKTKDITWIARGPGNGGWGGAG